MSTALAGAIQTLAKQRSLTAAETAAAFDVIMGGEASPAQIAAVLVALRVKGESADELTGVVHALRHAMQPVVVPDPDTLVDTCGTGGGVISTFNISTAAAFVAAGAGVRIAKHGNRSFTSACGSADVLEALGIRLDVAPDRLAAVLDAAGIIFMFAPAFHPAMRHVGPVRRELAIPTVMNLVGPLANPAGVRRQVVGVADRARLGLVGAALQQLGALHALVVFGEPGLDEFWPIGASHVVEVHNGVTREWTFDPASAGLARGAATDLAGGDPQRNAEIVQGVLGGRGTEAAQSAVILNAAAAIFVAGKAPAFDAAIGQAREALVSGRGLAALDALRRATRP